MLRSSKLISFKLLSAALFLQLALKVFTFELSYPDDPTVGVALKTHPSLESYHELTTTDSGYRYILGPDEGSYPGQKTYRFLVSWSCLLLLFALCIARLTRSRFRQRKLKD